MEDRENTLEFIEKYNKLKPEYQEVTSMLLDALVKVQRKKYSDVDNTISEILKTIEQLPVEHQEKVLEMVKTIEFRKNGALNENI